MKIPKHQFFSSWWIRWKQNSLIPSGLSTSGGQRGVKTTGSSAKFKPFAILGFPMESYPYCDFLKTQNWGRRLQWIFARSAHELCWQRQGERSQYCEIISSYLYHICCLLLWDCVFSVFDACFNYESFLVDYFYFAILRSVALPLPTALMRASGEYSLQYG